MPSCFVSAFISLACTFLCLLVSLLTSSLLSLLKSVGTITNAQGLACSEAESAAFNPEALKMLRKHAGLSTWSSLLHVAKATGIQ
jgi:hypothetical protein